MNKTINHNIPQIWHIKSKIYLPCRAPWQASCHWEYHTLIHLTTDFFYVSFSSVAQSCPTHGNPMDCRTPIFPVYSPSLLRLMFIELVMSSNHLSLCCLLLLLPSIFPSIRVISKESALCIRWPKYWNVSFNISPSSEYSGLIPFGMNWLDILAVQGTLKSLLQHHTWKASILWCSAFFIVQLSHLYMTTGKTIALTRWTFVDKGCICF